MFSKIISAIEKSKERGRLAALSEHRRERYYERLIKQLYQDRVTQEIKCDNCGWEGKVSNLLVVVDAPPYGYEPFWTKIHGIGKYIQKNDVLYADGVHCPNCQANPYEAAQNG